MPEDEANDTPEDKRFLMRSFGSDSEARMRRRFGDDWIGVRQSGLTRTAQGLWLPRSATGSVDATKNVKVYLTTAEIFNNDRPMSIEAIVRNVSEVSLELAIAWCASWVAKIYQPGRSHKDVDREFVDAYLVEPARTKVLNLLRSPQRVLLSPQALMVIMKIAIEHCRREGPPSEDVDVAPLVLAVLGVPSHLTSGVDDIPEDELVIDVNGGRLSAYVAANQIFNNPIDWRVAWTVFHRCLRELPSELNHHPRVLDFNAAYLDATGVALDDLVTVCAMLWGHSITDRGSTLPFTHFEPLGWDTARLDAALDLVAATPEELREALRQDATKFGLLWSTKTFDQFPVVRWDEHLTVLHPSWLVNRSTGAWPMLDVRRALELRGNRAEASRVAGAVEHTHEHFVLEAIESLTGTNRVYRDEALRRAYGKKKSVADAAIDYGDSWVVVEVSTRGFQLKTAAGVSEDALAQDLDNIVTKARQVQATIKNLRADQRSLTGRRAVRGRTFHPVVVVTSRFAGNPITLTMLRARLAAAEVLQAQDCAPLEVLDLEDLIAVLGTCERYGQSLRDLLAAKARIERPLVSMKEFLENTLGHAAPHPEIVKRSWREWMNTAVDELRQAKD